MNSRVPCTVALRSNGHRLQPIPKDVQSADLGVFVDRLSCCVPMRVWSCGTFVNANATVAPLCAYSQNPGAFMCMGFMAAFMANFSQQMDQTNAPNKPDMHLEK